MTSRLEATPSQHIVRGYLLHPDKTPLAHQKVVISAPGWFRTHKLGEGVTNLKGKFKITCNWNSNDEDELRNLLLEVYQETVPSEKGVLERMTDVIAFTFSSKRTTFTTNLYESQKKMPILKDALNFKRRPEQQTFDYKFRLIRAALGKKIKELFLRLFSSRISSITVQNAFGARNPELKVSQDSTIEMLLNGIAPCDFKVTKKNRLFYEINWDQYERDGGADLPNVSITLDNKNDSLSIRKISVHYPTKAKAVFRPSDNEFEKALYQVNSMFIVYGEACFHLAKGHLMTGQLALAFFRCIRKNPIKQLLKPHLDGVAEINRLGAGLIFGEGGVLNVSGLSAKGVDQLLAKTLSEMDFATFKPRKPLNETHRLAKAQNLYWDVVSKVVDKFFKEKNNEIKSNWREIYNMSTFLSENSLPYSPPSPDPYKKGHKWADENEIDNSKIQKRLSDKAIRPITLLKKDPKAEDILKLKQFCTYLIFLSTFYHDYIHRSQEKWVGNLAFGSLAPSNQGEGVFGGTKPKSAIRQLAVAQTLVDFDAPPLVEDPFKAIYPPLIKAIKKREKEFLELGYDITKMPYGVII